MRNYIVALLVVFISTKANASVLGIFEDTHLPVPTMKQSGVSRFSVYGEELYLSTTNGIYKYVPDNVNSWELFALEGTHVLDFVMCGNQIIAIANPQYPDMSAHKSARLIKCNIRESTYKDITTEAMQYSYYDRTLTYLCRMAQHPDNPETLIVATHGGIMQSEDFGESWTLLFDWCFGYNMNQFLGWHPNMPNVMFYTSEGGIFNATILRSENNGKDWDIIEPQPYDGDNSAHHIAFDSNDTSHLLLSGEGVIWESYDCGRSWIQIFKDDNGLGYAYSIMYHGDANIYCIGCRSNGQNIVIYNSIDNGKTWSRIAESDIFDNHEYWLAEGIIYNNKIFLNTAGGVFTYDLSGQSFIVNNIYEDSLKNPNYYDIYGRRIATPSYNQIYIIDGKKYITK